MGRLTGLPVAFPAKHYAVMRLRLAPPAVPEQQLHEAVARALQILLLPPVMWTCFPAGNVELPPAAAAKLARMGLQRGWPDLLILFGGRLYGIELKRAGGQLSKSRTVRTRRGGLKYLDGQADVFPRLLAAGMTIAVCNSVDDVLAKLQQWNVPMRRAAA